MARTVPGPSPEVVMEAWHLGNDNTRSSVSETDALATRQSTVAQTMRQGVALGVGHTLVLLVVGTVVLSLGRAVPERMAQALEFCVGVMLRGAGIRCAVAADPPAHPGSRSPPQFRRDTHARSHAPRRSRSPAVGA